LAWDPRRYLNIYTNTASGYLGYVPALPQDGAVGASWDGVVVLWSVVGRNAVGGAPYHQGRTLTHEVGHYLGLHHTFESGCTQASAPGCYTTGDLLCDTPSEGEPAYGCPMGRQTCGSTDPVDNYMDYGDDLCMTGFTVEQVARMRCTMSRYRTQLYKAVVACGDGIVNGSEQCDDGNTTWVPGEACRANCSRVACADPDDSGGEPTATDALFTLRAAVGTNFCDARVCNVDGSGDQPSATDALLALSRAVGADVPLACPN
jgi:cysteine-rich repeat protein